MNPELYPLGLRIAGRLVVVVGGGPVAARRTRSLVLAGAHVRVVAPEVCEDLALLVAPLPDGAARPDGPGAAGSVAWEARSFRPGDLEGAWLVHTATGSSEVDAAVAAEAEALRVFCVSAGDAEAGSAWVPAVARVTVADDTTSAATTATTEVVVAVNAGRDPRRAQRVRDAIDALLATGELPLRPVRPAAGRGSVALVGGGPGDPGLVTARGRRLLAQAEVVVTDRLGPRALLDELADDVVVIDVGKTPGFHPVPQEEINALLVEHALAGRRVVRLKGGDPYVFGRGGEELIACEEHGIPVEVVPGVTSAVSVPAAVGIPVTHRGWSRGFTVLTGHEDIGKVPAASDHTVVLLMGVSRLRDSAAALVASGRSPETPVAVVEDGYGPRQRSTVGTLATIADVATAAGVRAPAVTVIGDVVRVSPAWRAAGLG
ncbi:MULTISPECIES: uroporphyrinogen-III C-methyltransferase [Oerskovia]|uniref:uroporphyrinogen-III C-methyltransferase n=2 Tax=Oerskovia TaxID=162491 RepID=A0ABR8UZS0_9CELL|nr:MULTISPECIES: uroporphyrinogen-III C-methyltransferase [Oerskovia]MBD7997746.1 uroporphyrinogen-III C-methyltransferase [Oerskovia gallyi]MBM7496557.1 uroporphyrin-III C-methyltransferase/precorrin-2 dehydrogenase/sirohydrochlorin ferrochelatase [Oerskovia paurometabola]